MGEWPVKTERPCSQKKIRVLCVCVFVFVSHCAVRSPGRRTGAASTSAVGFEETERLLDESEWATGASSWRLGAATAPPTRDEDQVECAAAASSELLSLVRETYVSKRAKGAKRRGPGPHRDTWGGLGYVGVRLTSLLALCPSR